MKKILLATVFFYVVLEVLSFLAIRTYFSRWNHGFLFESEEFLSTLNESEYEKNMKYFDQILGWKEITGRTSAEEFGRKYTVTIDSKGKRKNPKLTEKIEISTYGDSFVKGDGVNDDQTFQYYLSEKLHKSVDNYGVSGYGTDQAVMKYQLNSEDKSNITILVVMSENIKRISNRFRKFYMPNSSIFPGFKPLVIQKEKNFHLFPVPVIKDKLDKTQLKVEIEKAKEIDLWASIRIKKRFPYFITFLKTIINQLAIENDLVILQKCFNYPGWENSDSLAVFRFWVSEFIETAKKRNQTPLLVFIPQALKFNDPPYIKEIQRMSNQIIICDFSENNTSYSASSLYLHPKSGHLSPFGNKVLAETIQTTIEEKLKK